MHTLDEDYEVPLPGDLQVRQPVDLQIVSETDLGFKASIDGRFVGLIYHDEISQPLRIGALLKGWIKAIRPDGKIDLSITTLDRESRDELEASILHYLDSNGGVAQLSDKSTPEEIHALFGASKKNFKRAIGKLYKLRQIVILDDRIKRV